MRYTQRALCIVLFAVLGAGTASAQFGVSAGLSFNQLSDIDTDPPIRFDDAAGYHIGLFYDLGTGPVGLRIGALYMDAGEFEFDVRGTQCGAPGGCPTQHFDLALVEVPVDLRIQVASTPVIRPYVLLGPVFRFATTDADAFEESLNEISLAGNAGVGVGIGTPGGLRFYPELRLGFGVSSITDGFEVQGAEFIPDEKQYLNTWMLRLSLSF